MSQNLENLKVIEPSKILGEGAYSTVLKAHFPGQEILALKKIDLSGFEEHDI